MRELLGTACGAMDGQKGPRQGYEGPREGYEVKTPVKTPAQSGPGVSH